MALERFLSDSLAGSSVSLNFRNWRHRTWGGGSRAPSGRPGQASWAGGFSRPMDTETPPVWGHPLKGQPASFPTLLSGVSYAPPMQPRRQQLRVRLGARQASRRAAKQSPGHAGSPSRPGAPPARLSQASCLGMPTLRKGSSKERIQAPE